MQAAELVCEGLARELEGENPCEEASKAALAAAFLVALQRCTVAGEGGRARFGVKEGSRGEGFNKRLEEESS